MHLIAPFLNLPTIFIYTASKEALKSILNNCMGFLNSIRVLIVKFFLVHKVVFETTVNIYGAIIYTHSHILYTLKLDTWLSKTVSPLTSQACIILYTIYS